ncbi:MULTISPECIES: thiamine phosphate synthase [Acidobacteriaceae]|uniref:thiamine phosphate synthase n=1 Tax=Acidobacteriaceae TaxID=204434 RepID=UPI00131B838F|nr:MULTISPECIES: thiamine phosphate synthase [Acidobacteriaceae]MDW5267214.1 thiamine phosphate synthase [Edaphobacter sp.]
MRRYAITDRSLLPAASSLLRQAALWAADGVDYIQLREKDLPPATLAHLSRQILEELQDTQTKLLINARLDIAVATGAHGVHLTSAPGELMPAQVRAVYAAANLARPVVSISCHSLAEVEVARNEADLILFAPVFQKEITGRVVTHGQGLEALGAACVAAAPASVYALGGVSWENADACLAAGAIGIAGIRLFHRL